MRSRILYIITNANFRFAVLILSLFGSLLLRYHQRAVVIIAFTILLAPLFFTLPQAIWVDKWERDHQSLRTDALSLTTETVHKVAR